MCDCQQNQPAGLGGVSDTVQTRQNEPLKSPLDSVMTWITVFQLLRMLDDFEL